MQDTFNTWLDILKAVPNAVLWLLQDNDESGQSYKQYAQQQGIEPERIVLAGRLPLDQHLARYALADLFLDTLPYNAHTTTSDALWAGVPVLTTKGKAFAGRVAASLLHAVGLPELVTENKHDYYAIAVKVGLDRDYRHQLKQQLQDNIPNCVLFDTPKYVRDLEQLYIQAWQDTVNNAMA